MSLATLQHETRLQNQSYYNSVTAREIVSTHTHKFKREVKQEVLPSYNLYSGSVWLKINKKVVISCLIPGILKSVGIY